MKIDNLKQLKALIRTCRDEGVNRITVDGIEMTLEGAPKIKPSPTPGAYTPDPGTFDPGTIPTPDVMTEEQRMFGSSDPTVWQEKQ